LELGGSSVVGRDRSDWTLWGFRNRIISQAVTAYGLTGVQVHYIHYPHTGHDTV
jgi:hypothetical protein